MKKHPVHIYQDGKMLRIGTYIVQEDGLTRFRSQRNKNLHFFIKENGWALDRKVFVGLMKKGLELVEIDEREDCILYYTPAENFQNHGKVIDYGHGEQIVLPLEYWNKK